MLSLWNKLALIYGSRWEREYGLAGGKVFLEWEAELSKLKVDQLRKGFKSLMAEGSEFPPNLIKFLRLCRATDPYSTHKSQPKLDRPLPRYSVRRIELMKQQFLFGGILTIPEHVEGYINDWTPEDEELLIEAMSQFTPDTPLEVVNRTIDYIEFSHGTQRENAHAI